MKNLLLIMVVFLSQSCGPLKPMFARWSGEARQIELEAEGKAKLAESISDRKVQIEDAKGKLESAKLHAQAEIERAKGVAEANRIIGSSLKGNESYLRYLWIQNLDKGKGEVIYVPTEANLPILEATRRKK